MAKGVANGLRELRQRYGLTQEQLAHELDVTRHTILALEVGRYIAPRVFLGARQSASGGTQANVQFDITKGLKLETTAGMGGGNPQGGQDTSGSSVGLTYQFEY